MDARALGVAAKTALPAVVPIVGTILEAVRRSQDAVAQVEATDPDSLADEVRRQQMLMEHQAHTARVTQELAIADRIASADEVEIEEFYEGTGKGTAGLKFDGAKAVTAGLSGEGQRVSRRIVKLRGTAPQPTID